MRVCFLHNIRKFKKYINKRVQALEKETGCTLPKPKKLSVAHKKWIHTRFYVRRRLSKDEQDKIRILMRTAHNRFKNGYFGRTNNNRICLEQFVILQMQKGKDYETCVDVYDVICETNTLRHVAVCDCMMFRGNYLIGQECPYCHTLVAQR